ncbi:hypothetical protein WDV76_19285 [Xenorhabdus griffiniae]|nr:hypothetical protein [Xenorhabdus griffiniae]MDC9605227.1 hypothetical protein [Xenorhabdus griffiniae]
MGINRILSFDKSPDDFVTQSCISDEVFICGQQVVSLEFIGTPKSNFKVRTTALILIEYTTLFINSQL